MNTLKTIYAFSFFLLILFHVEGTVKKLTVFSVTDMHCNISGEKSNILKLSTILSEQVNLAGGYDKCLIIDSGDTFQGSSEAAITKGKIAVDILNYLKVNVFVPGNHEFDFGIPIFLKNLSNLTALTLAANLKFKDDTNQKEIKKWNIFKVNGIKVAVIGMTYPFTDYWIHMDKNSLFSISDIGESLKKIMPEIMRQSPDIIIMAVHHGIYGSGRFKQRESLEQVMRKYPQITLVLGGHTHQGYPGSLPMGKSYYFQAGSHGEYLGKIEIFYEMTNGSYNIKSELIPVAAASEDMKLLKILKPELDFISALKKETIVSTNKIGSFKDNFHELAAKIMCETTNSDAAIFGLSGKSIITGNEITYNDVYRDIKYEDTIITLTVSQSELKNIVDELEKADKKSKYYDGIASWNVKKCISNNNNSSIKLAVTSYYAAGGGGQYPFLRKLIHSKKHNASDTGLELREVIIDYLKNLHSTTSI